MTVCYLCGGCSIHQRPGRVRDAMHLKVLECDDCGLVFLSSFAHIGAAHYEVSGMHGDDPVAIDAWLRDTDADDARRFGLLHAMLAGKSVLDFGCGVGGFLLYARKSASAVEGVEPEARLQPHFRDAGLKVSAGIDTVTAAGSRFDVITAFHVVEHLPDPRSILSRLAALLRPGGTLVIEVPNSDDALLTLYQCESFMHFTYWSQHLFLFNARTLSELVHQAGLKTLWLKQVQRFPLSNHLHWLSRGKPGGHREWAFLGSADLDAAYSAQLAALGRCDTLLAGLTLGARSL